MNALRQFFVVEVMCVVALLAVAGGLGLGAFVLERAADPGEAPTIGLLYFWGALIFGAPFVAVYGAPAYWALLRRGRATWRLALALGVTPGAVILLANWWFGVLYVGCGGAVATLTHWMCTNIPLAAQRSPVHDPA